MLGCEPKARQRAPWRNTRDQLLRRMQESALTDYLANKVAAIAHSQLCVHPPCPFSVRVLGTKPDKKEQLKRVTSLCFPAFRCTALYHVYAGIALITRRSSVQIWPPQPGQNNLREMWSHPTVCFFDRWIGMARLNSSNAPYSASSKNRSCSDAVMITSAFLGEP